MANIFENKLNRKIPKNLSQCIVADEASKELFLIAKRIENSGIISAVLISVIGIITLIILAIIFKLALILLIMLIIPVIAYGIYYKMHCNALEMCAYATIVHNTNITSNLQMYYFKKELNEEITYSEKPNKKHINKKVVEPTVQKV